MTTVWVVLESHWDDCDVVAVFDTEEAANAYAAGTLFVVEVPLNPPPRTPEPAAQHDTWREERAARPPSDMARKMMEQPRETLEAKRAARFAARKRGE